MIGTLGDDFSLVSSLYNLAPGTPEHTAFGHCLSNLVRELRHYKDRLGDEPERGKQAEGTHPKLIPNVAPNAEAVETVVRDGDYTAFRLALSGYDAHLAREAETGSRTF